MFSKSFKTLVADSGLFIFMYGLVSAIIGDSHISPMQLMAAGLFQIALYYVLEVYEIYRRKK